jgi:hypothetical protein
MVGHSKNWEMGIDTFKKALDSLSGWNKVIGLIGGDPLLHTKFEDLTEIFKQKVPDKSKRGLWTSNFRDKEKYCRNDYGYINFNNHKEDVRHTPNMCSICDIVKDKNEMMKYINDCWLADKWSPSITPKGVYRCEVQGAMDMVLNKNLGLPIEKGWFNRPLKDFENQINELCPLCSISIPLQDRSDKDVIDDITPTALKVFKDSPKIKSGKYKLHEPLELKLKTKDGWRPYKYFVRMR